MFRLIDIEKLDGFTIGCVLVVLGYLFSGMALIGHYLAKVPH